MISQLLTYDGSATYRNVVKRRGACIHARRRIRITVYDTEGVTTYRFFGWLKPRDNSRGKCSRANFSYILSDMIYFIPGFGEFVEESVYGWFMASEGGISILDCCIRNELSLHS